MGVRKVLAPLEGLACRAVTGGTAHVILKHMLSASKGSPAFGSKVQAKRALGVFLDGQC